jgi:hypothetical protein
VLPQATRDDALIAWLTSRYDGFERLSQVPYECAPGAPDEASQEDHIDDALDLAFAAL